MAALAAQNPWPSCSRVLTSTWRVATRPFTTSWRACRLAFSASAALSLTWAALAATSCRPAFTSSRSTISSTNALLLLVTCSFRFASYSSPSFAIRYRWPSCRAFFNRPALATRSSRRSVVKFFPRKGNMSSSASSRALSTLSLTLSSSAMMSGSCSIKPLAALSLPSWWGDSRASKSTWPTGTPY